jgi:hypothetical protein
MKSALGFRTLVEEIYLEHLTCDFFPRNRLSPSLP